MKRTLLLVLFVTLFGIAHLESLPPPPIEGNPFGTANVCELVFDDRIGVPTFNKPIVITNITSRNNERSEEFQFNIRKENNNFKLSNTYVAYRAFPITFTKDGFVWFNLTFATRDSYLLVYKNNFNPLEPLTNLWEVNDDYPGRGVDSSIKLEVDAGTQYIIVHSSFFVESQVLFNYTYIVEASDSTQSWDFEDSCSDLKKDCKGEYTGATYDQCGVCGGDGDTCCHVPQATYACESGMCVPDQNSCIPVKFCSKCPVVVCDAPNYLCVDGTCKNSTDSNHCPLVQACTEGKQLCNDRSCQVNCTLSNANCPTGAPFLNTKTNKCSSVPESSGGGGSSGTTVEFVATVTPDKPLIILVNGTGKSNNEVVLPPIETNGTTKVTVTGSTQENTGSGTLRKKDYIPIAYASFLEISLTTKSSVVLKGKIDFTLEVLPSYTNVKDQDVCLARFDTRTRKYICEDSLVTYDKSTKTLHSQASSFGIYSFVIVDEKESTCRYLLPQRNSLGSSQCIFPDVNDNIICYDISDLFIKTRSIKVNKLSGVVRECIGYNRDNCKVIKKSGDFHFYDKKKICINRADGCTSNRDPMCIRYYDIRASFDGCSAGTISTILVPNTLKAVGHQNLRTCSSVQFD